MVSTLALINLLAVGSPQVYWSGDDMVRALGSFYLKDRRSIEAKDEICVRVANHKSELPELPKDILDSPTKLRLPVSMLSGRFWMDEYVAVAVLSHSARLAHLGNVTDELILAYNEARKSNNRSVAVQAFERYRKDLNIPVLNSGSSLLIRENFRIGPSAPFRYDFDPKYTGYLSDLRENFGVKIFHSDLPKFRIAYVTPKSLASQVGLQAGDEILKVNSRLEQDPIEKFTQLSRVRKSEIWLQVKKFNGSVHNLVIKVPGF